MQFPLNSKYDTINPGKREKNAVLCPKWNDLLCRRPQKRYLQYKTARRKLKKRRTEIKSTWLERNHDSYAHKCKLFKRYHLSPQNFNESTNKPIQLMDALIFIAYESSLGFLGISQLHSITTGLILRNQLNNDTKHIYSYLNLYRDRKMLLKSKRHKIYYGNFFKKIHHGMGNLRYARRRYVHTLWLQYK